MKTNKHTLQNNRKIGQQKQMIVHKQSSMYPSIKFIQNPTRQFISSFDNLPSKHKTLSNNDKRIWVYFAAVKKLFPELDQSTSLDLMKPLQTQNCQDHKVSDSIVVNRTVSKNKLQIKDVWICQNQVTSYPILIYFTEPSRYPVVKCCLKPIYIQFQYELSGVVKCSKCHKTSFSFVHLDLNSTTVNKVDKIGQKPRQSSTNGSAQSENGHKQKQKQAKPQQGAVLQNLQQILCANTTNCVNQKVKQQTKDKKREKKVKNIIDCQQKEQQNNMSNVNESYGCNFNKPKRNLSRQHYEPKQKQAQKNRHKYQNSLFTISNNTLEMSQLNYGENRNAMGDIWIKCRNQQEMRRNRMENRKMFRQLKQKQESNKQQIRKLVSSNQHRYKSLKKFTRTDLSGFYKTSRLAAYIKTNKNHFNQLSQNENIYVNEAVLFNNTNTPQNEIDSLYNDSNMKVKVHYIQDKGSQVSRNIKKRTGNVNNIMDFGDQQHGQQVQIGQFIIEIVAPTFNNTNMHRNTEKPQNTECSKIDKGAIRNKQTHAYSEHLNKDNTGPSNMKNISKLNEQAYQHEHQSNQAEKQIQSQNKKEISRFQLVNLSSKTPFQPNNQSQQNCEWPGSKNRVIQKYKQIKDIIQEIFI